MKKLRVMNDDNTLDENIMNQAQNSSRPLSQLSMRSRSSSVAVLTSCPIKELYFTCLSP